MPSKRPREEETQAQEEQQPKGSLKESPEESVQQYRMTMRRYHTEEVAEKAKFDRRCAKLLDELVEAINVNDNIAMTRKVTEYFDLKCDYQLSLSSMACMKRMLRESRFPHLVKAAAKIVPDKQ